jgi:hypothetical protein
VLGLLLLMLVLEVVACIRVSCTTILDLQNSKESQNSWNCGSPQTFWSRRVPRNCGTQKHIGMAASHGTAQFRSNPVPTKGFGPGGFHGAVGVGMEQQVKPRTCKAGGGWVGGDYRRPQGHEQTKPFEGVSSAPSTTRLYRRAHHPHPMWGPDWLAMLRVRIQRKCKECGAPRNTMECMEMLDLSKSLGPLNMLNSCVILRHCAESV